MSESNRPVQYGPYDFDGTRDEVVKLRCAGRGIDFIAHTLGMHREAVAKILRSEFEIRIGNRQQLIERTALELDFLKSDLIRKYQNQGDRRDAELVLKFIDRKCKLFGLDAPTKVEVKVEDLSEEELVRQLELNGIGTNLKQLPQPVEDAEFEVRTKELDPSHPAFDPPQ